jgi:hypothetical protein
MHNDFNVAPLDTRAKLLTLCVVALLAVVGRENPLALLILMGLIVLATAVFGIRGYRVTGDEIQVRHYGWSQRWALRDMVDATMRPGVVAGSMRTFGIGGFFGYVGRFRNGMLGNYHAYLTDSSRAVVLRFVNDTLVVSPADPLAFVSQVYRSRIP